MTLKNAKYLCSVILFCALSIRNLLFTYSNKLPDTVFSFYRTHTTCLLVQSLPYRLYVLIGHVSWNHASRITYGMIVTRYEVLKNIDISVRILVREILVQFIV